MKDVMGQTARKPETVVRFDNNPLTVVREYFKIARESAASESCNEILIAENTDDAGRCRSGLRWTHEHSVPPIRDPY